MLTHYETKITEWKERQKLADEREKTIKRQFSALDGSHKKLENFIKQTMKDPNSYEHVKTEYRDMDTYLLVKTTFRGRNSFGGVVINSVEAVIDIDGNVLKTTNNSP